MLTHDEQTGEQEHMQKNAFSTVPPDTNRQQESQMRSGWRPGEQGKHANTEEYPSMYMSELH
jgi:hypothetical protein